MSKCYCLIDFLPSLYLTEDSNNIILLFHRHLLPNYYIADSIGPRFEDSWQCCTLLMYSVPSSPTIPLTIKKIQYHHLSHYVRSQYQLPSSYLCFAKTLPYTYSLSPTCQFTAVYTSHCMQK